MAYRRGARDACRFIYTAFQVLSVCILVTDTSDLIMLVLKKNYMNHFRLGLNLIVGRTVYKRRYTSQVPKYRPRYNAKMPNK